MTSEQREFRPLGECELNRISAGRVCDQGGTRMEINIPFGREVLVIWATSGSHGDGVGCSGTYWKVP
jgi:hypothetical protein